MFIANLTPHDINFVTPIYNEDGSIFEYERDMTIPASGIVARVSADITHTGDEICGIPVSKTVFGEVQNLPDPVKGVCYIVSKTVAERVPDRDDVFITNESVHDESGKIVGCMSIAHI